MFLGPKNKVKLNWILAQTQSNEIILKGHKGLQNALETLLSTHNLSCNKWSGNCHVKSARMVSCSIDNMYYAYQFMEVQLTSKSESEQIL